MSYFFPVILFNSDKNKRRHMSLLRYGQGIIQTKLEVGVRFWVPSLGLSTKYDYVTF